MNAVRNIYKGLICVESDPWGLDLRIYKDVDYHGFVIFDSWPWVLGKSKKPEVKKMLDRLRSGLDDQIWPHFLKWGKPIILMQIAANSFNGAAMGFPGDIEKDIAPWFPDNPKFPLDLQEQADIYEAILHAITERDWIAGAYSFFYGYSDKLCKDINIRSKPAEKVLAKWFGWLQGKFAKIEINKSTINFEGAEGKEDPAPKYFRIKNSGKEILKYKISADENWLKILPKNGESKGEWDKIKVSVNIKSLKKGKYSGTIEVTSPNAYNSRQEIRVNLTIE